MQGSGSVSVFASGIYKVKKRKPLLKQQLRVNVSKCINVTNKFFLCKVDPLTLSRELDWSLANIASQGPTQSVWVADCYFIVNVLDLPFASPIVVIYR